MASLTEMLTLLIGIFAAGVVVGLTIGQILSDRRRAARRAWWARSRQNREKHGDVRPVAGPWQPQSDRPDAADQLRIVLGATFTIQPLLNKREARLFKELDRMVIGSNPAWQVMAQVSLGEILRCSDAQAYSCINSKRVDLLLVDGDCQPRHAIEYHGTGHHQGTAAARDAVKKEALRRAGIGYHEIVGGQTTPSELRSLVARLVEKPEPPDDGEPRPP